MFASSRKAVYAFLVYSSLFLCAIFHGHDQRVDQNHKCNEMVELGCHNQGVNSRDELMHTFFLFFLVLQHCLLGGVQLQFQK